MKRLTLIANFNEENLEKIKSTLVGINEEMCRIPYIEGLDRELTRDLPIHFTLYSWGEEYKKEVINYLSKFDFKECKAFVTGVQIMNGRNGSYVLYYKLEVNEEILRVTRELNKIYHNKKYENNYEYHITICISKDYDKIIKIKDLLLERFVPFDISVSKLTLYEIYPAVVIRDFKSI